MADYEVIELCMKVFFFISHETHCLHEKKSDFLETGSKTSDQTKK